MNQPIKSPPRSASGNGLREIAGKQSNPDYTGSPASKFLSRVSTAKQTGPGEWMCSCPGPLHEHGDRHPSLSLKEEPDGTLLMHCLAGCDPSEVLGAVGLELRDLYPEPLSHHKSPLSKFQRKRHGQALDVLKAIRHEILIVHIAARMVQNSEALDDESLDRLATAEYRIAKAAEVAV